MLCFDFDLRSVAFWRSLFCLAHFITRAVAHSRHWPPLALNSQAENSPTSLTNLQVRQRLRSAPRSGNRLRGALRLPATHCAEHTIPQNLERPRFASQASAENSLPQLSQFLVTVARAMPIHNPLATE